MTEPATYRIGVDIGGTFTDLVMVDTRTGVTINEKVLTTPDDPSRAVLAGFDALLRKRAPGGRIDRFIHGTTLVANALIERKGVSTAFVTTKGFRDVLAIGRERRYDIYDLFIEMPEPLVPRALRFEVDERIGPSGNVIVPVDEAEVVALAKRVAATPVKAVAVCFLHSFQNSTHEDLVRRIFLEHAPRLTVSLSSEIIPVIGEYERMTTAVANAYVQPIFSRYIEILDKGLRERDYAGDLLLMLSDGGLVHKDTAIDCPIRVVQSGPAGGAQAARLYSRTAGFADAICFDMGGTTAKSCLIEGGEPLRTTDFEVARVYRFAKGSGLPLKVPVVDMIEIGAGGGSIAKLDSLGFIQVGPESASSVPGPACYGRGGERATVTDADLVLGYLAEDSFLGGEMRLSRANAEQVLKRDIGDPLGIDAIEAAWAVHDAVNDQMAHATSIYALEKGRKVENYALIAIGGAGPVHASHLASKLGLDHVICPLGAGVASAIGFTIAPASFEMVRARVEELEALDFDAVETLISTLEARCGAMVARAGIAAADTTTTVWAFMRYVGQGYEVEVPLPRDVLLGRAHNELMRHFRKAYIAHYGRAENVPVEVVAWRVVVSGVDQNHFSPISVTRPAGGSALKGCRNAYFPEWRGFGSADVYDRYALQAGFEGHGPAIIEETESTLIVPPSVSFRVDDALNVVLDLRGVSGSADRSAAVRPVETAAAG